MNTAQQIADYRQRKLGRFIGCNNGSCNHGEWSAKATGRGWSHRNGQWLCPNCKPHKTP